MHSQAGQRSHRHSTRFWDYGIDPDLLMYRFMFQESDLLELMRSGPGGEPLTWSRFEVRRDRVLRRDVTLLRGVTPGVEDRLPQEKKRS